jgi:hypothetical protein
VKPGLGWVCILLALVATALSIAMCAYPQFWIMALSWGLAVAFYILAAVHRGRVLTPLPSLIALANAVVLFVPIGYSAGVVLAMGWAAIYLAILLAGGTSIQMLIRSEGAGEAAYRSTSRP